MRSQENAVTLFQEALRSSPTADKLPVTGQAEPPRQVRWALTALGHTQPLTDPLPALGPPWLSDVLAAHCTPQRSGGRRGKPGLPILALLSPSVLSLPRLQSPFPTFPTVHLPVARWE